MSDATKNVRPAVSGRADSARAEMTGDTERQRQAYRPPRLRPLGRIQPVLLGSPPPPPGPPLPQWPPR